jgi:hypothetical protein
VTLRLVAASLAVGALVLLVVAVTDLTLGRAALLAPAFVVGFAAVLGLTIFWSKVALQSLREARHPRLVVTAAVGFVSLLVGLTLLGVNLPRE